MIGQEIFAWQTEATHRLADSAWTTALEVAGGSGLDLLLTPIFTELQAEIRGSAAPRPPQGAISRGLAALRQRRWPGAMLERLARWQSARPQPAEVVLWPREPTHLVNLLPVATELRRQGTDCLFVACQPAIFAALRRAGEETVFTRGAWSEELLAARQLADQQLAQLARDPEVELPAGPMSRQRLLSAVRRALKMLPLAHESAAAALEIVQHLAPRVLVVGNDLTVEGRAGAWVAESRSLPTCSLMHGTVTGSTHAAHRVRRFLIYGEAARDTLIHLGVEPKRLSLVGCPGLGQRRSATTTPHPALARRFGLSKEQPWVLVATSGPGHSISHRHHLQLVRGLAQLSAEMAKVTFVVKLHRKDRLDCYQRVASEQSASRLRVIAHGARGLPKSIFEWLQGCPLLITGASTVALEAMLMEVPVVTVDLADELHDIDFIDARTSQHVQSIQELGAAIQNTFDQAAALAPIQERANRFAERVYGPLDGRSAARAAGEIHQLLGSVSQQTAATWPTHRPRFRFR